MPSLELQINEKNGTMLDRIMSLENQLIELPQIELPVNHYFADGLYARELTIPAGVALTGYVHLTEHLCTLSQGEMEIADIDGVRTIKAPCTFISKPGIKRAGFAISDSVFTTYHATRVTDIEELERTLVVSSIEEYQKLTNEVSK